MNAIVGQNYIKMINNKCFENVAKLDTWGRE